MQGENNAEAVLESRTIDWLRMPLIIAVIFIHSSMGEIPTAEAADRSMYDYLRIACSYVLSHCAVPTFFLVSGYLFFARVGEWSRQVYADKLRRRVHSLLVPYFLWTFLCVAVALLAKAVGGLVKGDFPNRVYGYLDSLAYWNWHVLWDYHWWNLEQYSLWGYVVPISGPFLVPFWFLRDLMAVTLLTPVIYYGYKRLGRAFAVAVLVMYLLSAWPIAFPGLSITAVAFYTTGGVIALSGQRLTVSLYRSRYVCGCVAALAFPFLVYFTGARTLAGFVVYPFFVLCMTVTAVSVGYWLVGKGYVAARSWFGPASFFVYALHAIYCVQFSGWLVGKLLPWEGQLSMTLRYLLAPFVCAAICLAAYRLMERFAPCFLRRLTGRRKV